MPTKHVFAILELGAVQANGVRTETFRSVANSVDQAEVWIARQLLKKKRGIKVYLLRAAKKRELERENPCPKIPENLQKPIFDPNFHNTPQRNQEYAALVSQWEMDVEAPWIEEVLKYRVQLDKELKQFMKQLKINEINVSDIHVVQEETYITKPVEAA